MLMPERARPSGEQMVSHRSHYAHEHSSRGMTTFMKASQARAASNGTVRDEVHTTGALSKSMNGWLKHHMKDWPKVWAASTGRIHGWRVPPRWALADWWEEIDAESIAAACHAIRIFDPHRGPKLESFVYHQILASALSRYRQEWTYALRYGLAPTDDPGIPGTDDRFAIEQDEEQLKARMVEPARSRPPLARAPLLGRQHRN